LLSDAGPLTEDDIRILVSSYYQKTCPRFSDAYF
jgi:hypothetical protein